MGRLNRPRTEADALHMIEAAFMRNTPLGPKPFHQPDRFLGPAASMPEGDLNSGEVVLPPAEADAERDSPAGKKIQGGDGLGQERRVSQSRQQDSGSNPDPLSHRRRLGQ